MRNNGLRRWPFGQLRAGSEGQLYLDSPWTQSFGGLFQQLVRVVPGLGPPEKNFNLIGAIH